MDLNLDGRTALVSGSTAGIGYATAEGLAGLGARVIVNGRTAGRVAAAAAAIVAKHPNARIERAPFDLSNAAGTDAIARAFPNVDIVVNNLGIFEPKPFEEIPDADWLRFFEINVMSGSAEPGVFTVSARAELGTYRLRFKRIRHQYPGRDGALRSDEDGSACRGPRYRGVRRRNGHHGQ